VVSVSLRTLFQEKLRFAMGAGGVALAVMLILVLEGMFAGVQRQITAYLDMTGADLIVAQKDSRNFLGARSTVPVLDIGPVERTTGVAKVVPGIVKYAVLDLHQRKEFSLMIGFDRARGGGPWEMREGTALIADGDAIFDAVVAKRHGISVGDSVKILGKELRVAGLSGGTSSWMTGTFFVTFDTASELLAARGNPSFLLVKVESGTNPVRVARAIEAKTGLTATERSVVNANDLALYSRILSGPLQAMIVVAFLIGVALVGLTIYTATVERTKEFAALKAIGMRNGRLYLMVLEQALISSVVGFVAGVGLAFGAQRLLGEYAPQFLVAIDPLSVARILAIAILMGAFSALVPARAIAAIDPMAAFRRGA
jgi:putative ABC transport system permease protein